LGRPLAGRPLAIGEFVKNLNEEQMQQRADVMWDEREFELDFATACNMMLGKPYTEAVVAAREWVSDVVETALVA
jgi:hypothetical protein